jgi:gamma-glutamylcyclotransferase (GGCT)/AIG2-like uncharacterized protein YtfP
MSQRAPESKPKCIATLPNFKLVFAASQNLGYGVATIRPFKGEKVIGAVYEISDKDLKLLDRYEGYPTTYDRRKVIVFTETNDPVEAITYIKNDQSHLAPPAKEYLEIMRQGYRDWQID